MGISVEVRLVWRSAWVISMEICRSLAWNGGGCFGFRGFELCEIRGFGYDWWVFVVVVWVGSTSLMMVVTIMAMVASGSGSGCGFEFVI